VTRKVRQGHHPFFFPGSGRGRNRTERGPDGIRPAARTSPSSVLSSPVDAAPCLPPVFPIRLFFLFAAVVLRRFFNGPVSSSVTKSPSWEDACAPLLARAFRKSDTTCCNRLLAYACRFRGAYDPAPESTSKKAFRLPCLFAEVALWYES